MTVINKPEMVLRSALSSILNPQAYPPLRSEGIRMSFIRGIEISQSEGCQKLSMRSWERISVVRVDGTSHIAEGDYMWKTYTDFL